MVPVFARQESQVSREALDPRDRQALPVHQARKDPRDHVETEARQGNQEITGPKAPRGAKGDSGSKGSQGSPGPQGPPGALGSNWKQCVWKNLNDGRDTGLIKVNV